MVPTVFEVPGFVRGTQVAFRQFSDFLKRFQGCFKGLSIPYRDPMVLNKILQFFRWFQEGLSRFQVSLEGPRGA